MGISLAKGHWRKPPAEGLARWRIFLLPELCDWTPLTSQICQVGPSCLFLVAVASVGSRPKKHRWVSSCRELCITYVS